MHSFTRTILHPTASPLFLALLVPKADSDGNYTLYPTRGFILKSFARLHRQPHAFKHRDSLGSSRCSGFMPLSKYCHNHVWLGRQKGKYNKRSTFLFVFTLFYCSKGRLASLMIQIPWILTKGYKAKGFVTPYPWTPLQSPSGAEKILLKKLDWGF